MGHRVGKFDMTRGYMKDDIVYAIVLLRKVMGLPIVGHLQTWMVHFIETIIMTNMPINWVTILSDNLDVQLVAIRVDPCFYIISYMVYLLETRVIDYQGLYKKGGM